MARLQHAEDLEDEAARLDDERLDCFEPSEGLWGLDIGVASATIALSALGAIPVGSCNAGGFGGHHQGASPLCRLLPRNSRARRRLSPLLGPRMSGCAVIGAGLAQIFAAGDFDLFRFAQTARDRYGQSRVVASCVTGLASSAQSRPRETVFADHNNAASAGEQMSGEDGGGF